MKEEKQMKNDNECWPEGWVTFSIGGGCGTGTGRQSRRKREQSQPPSTRGHVFQARNRQGTDPEAPGA